MPFLFMEDVLIINKTRPAKAWQSIIVRRKLLRPQTLCGIQLCRFDRLEAYRD